MTINRSFIVRVAGAYIAVQLAVVTLLSVAASVLTHHTPAASGAVPTASKADLGKVKLENLVWHKPLFNRYLIADFTVQNDSDQWISDMVCRCTLTGNHGATTVLSQPLPGENVFSHSQLNLRSMNIGHDWTGERDTRVSCSISSAVTGPNPKGVNH